jgi:hypothetical protein
VLAGGDRNHGFGLRLSLREQLPTHEYAI